MNPDSFRDLPTEPESAPLAALWLAARGDWSAAHMAVQKGATPDESWVHAYLHRKEGDVPNARYWYDRAGKPEFTGSLEAEWAALVQALS